MNLSTTETFSLNKWQRCYFHLKSSDATCVQKANAIRGILAQIEVAHANKSISNSGAMHLTKQYGGLLSSIVDSQTGLNNYAEQTLTLCANHRNESQEWRSALTSESLLENEHIQNMLKHSQDFKTNQMNQSTIVVRTKQPGTNRVQNPVTACQNQPESAKPATISHQVYHQQNINVKTEGGHYKQQNCSTYSTSGQSSKFNPTLSVFESHFKSDLKVKSSLLKSDRNSNVNHNKLFYDSESGPSNSNRRLYNSDSGPSTSNSCLNNVDLNRKYPDAGPTADSGRQNLHRSRLFGGDLLQQQSANKRTLHDMYECDMKKSSHVSRTLNQDDVTHPKQANNFLTARDQLTINNQKKNRGREESTSGSTTCYGTSRKVLGTRRGLNSKFVPPIMNKDEVTQETRNTSHSGSADSNECIDERLKNIDPKMIELVMNEVMDNGPPIHWDDIAGLEFAKSTIKEIVVWPMLRPDIFHGLRGPPKGLLLFGPPGTGKTLIGKCIANQSGATFFSISASSLTSKWIGEGEKMVRALFAVSRCHQPAVIFIDEIDSLLSQRSADEHESSRRIKTEFLVQLDGATTNSEDRLLVVGATNRPHEIDEAARRRLVKRLYIPLPDAAARKQIVTNLLSTQAYVLSESELNNIQEQTEGYSGADVANLCREAALGPVRCIKDIQQVSADQVRPMLFKDFQAALKTVRPSVSQQDLNIYLEWNKQYGSGI
ncbi:fidgetin-like protein 1 isoform X2 [Antedon mediterranea]